MRAGYRTALRIAACLGAALAAAPAAHAARPLITDDARLVDPQACQVEAWTKRGYQDDIREFWALPACNPTGNLELTVGGNRLNLNDEDRQSTLVIQGKTLFRRLEGDDWAVGLVVGGAKASPSSNGGPSLLYGYVPLTVARFDQRLILHFNLGAYHSYEERRTAVNWGAAAEIAVWGERAYLIAEAYDDSFRRSEYQVGLRFWLIPDRVQIDTTYGGQFGVANSGHFYTVGLRLLSPPFLPRW
ncbi:MAG: hypothetical protein MUF79_05590 [Burkholderiales bacterium]|nr:hypothetical protein [Burkholderiales bacterium]